MDFSGRRGRYVVRMPSMHHMLDALFIFFCMFPFLLPNPIISSDMQPYAAVLGTFVCLANLKSRGTRIFSKNHLIVLSITFTAAAFILVLSGMSMNAIRGFFNYYSVFVIPIAVGYVLDRYRRYPEKLIKGCILLWFGICTIQFVVNRRFGLVLVSGARHGVAYRGICGLASEPSFLGICSFYMLHLIRDFKKNQLLYAALVIIMGTLYAQSAMGIIFIAAYWMVYLLDMTSTKKGFYIWVGTILAVFAGGYFLLNSMKGTRIYEMVTTFLNGGVAEVLTDASANTRMDSIVEALSDAWNHYLLPQGFQNRIGSGYGGFLCELGFFAIPVICLISLMMSKSFRQKKSQWLYFVVITVLLCNNTQIGHPMLLMIVGCNMYYRSADSLRKRRGI